MATVCVYVCACVHAHTQTGEDQSRKKEDMEMTNIPSCTIKIKQHEDKQPFIEQHFPNTLYEQSEETIRSKYISKIRMSKEMNSAC